MFFHKVPINQTELLIQHDIPECNTQWASWEILCTTIKWTILNNYFPGVQINWITVVMKTMKFGQIVPVYVVTSIRQ